MGDFQERKWDLRLIFLFTLEIFINIMQTLSSTCSKFVQKNEASVFEKNNTMSLDKWENLKNLKQVAIIQKLVTLANLIVLIKIVNTFHEGF